MQVNGYLDQQKAGMLSELDKFLSLWIAYNPLGRCAVRRCHSIAIARRNCRYRADITPKVIIRCPLSLNGRYHPQEPSLLIHDGYLKHVDIVNVFH